MRLILAPAILAPLGVALFAGEEPTPTHQTNRGQLAVRDATLSQCVPSMGPMGRSWFREEWGRLLEEAMTSRLTTEQFLALAMAVGMPQPVVLCVHGEMVEDT